VINNVKGEGGDPLLSIIWRKPRVTIFLFYIHKVCRNNSIEVLKKFII